MGKLGFRGTICNNEAKWEHAKVGHAPPIWFVFSGERNARPNRLDAADTLPHPGKASCRGHSAAGLQLMATVCTLHGRACTTHSLVNVRPIPAMRGGRQWQLAHKALRPLLQSTTTLPVLAHDQPVSKMPVLSVNPDA